MDDHTIEPWFELAKISDLVPVKTAPYLEDRRRYLGKDIIPYHNVRNSAILAPGYANGASVGVVPPEYTLYVQSLCITAIDQAGVNQLLTIERMDNSTDPLWAGFLVADTVPGSLTELTVSMQFPAPYVEYKGSAELRMISSNLGQLHFTTCLIGFLVSEQQSPP